MSQNGEEPKYTLVKSDGTVEHTSRHYDGSGVATYENKDSYEGDFVKGLRTGRGIYRYQDEAGGAVGSKYDGEWKENLRHGIGKMHYFGVGDYHGYWENGRRHGEGVFTYEKSGDVYSGWWRFGEKNGNGTYVYKKSGMRLVGTWKNGMMEEG